MLNKKIAIYVPSTNGNKAIDNDMHNLIAKQIAKKLSEICGGATIIKGIGNWINEQKELVCEDVSIVYAYTAAESFTEHYKQAKAIAEDLRYFLNQDAVTLETNEGIEFIERA